MIYSLSDFVREYKKICEMGWIKTHRAGSTGVGKTLEDILGIPENNIDAPDFGEYELKSSRIGSNSMLTIFTKTPQPRGAINVLRENFGYPSNAYNNTEKVLHATLWANRFVKIDGTIHSLKISCTPNKVSIIAEDNIEYAYWSIEQLKYAFEKKYQGKLIYARAYSRGFNTEEEFKYLEAFEVSGFGYDTFINLLKEGKICVDLRIGQYHTGNKEGQTHDHGTGFRIRENDQPLLFRFIKRIV